MKRAVFISMTILLVAGVTGFASAQEGQPRRLAFISYAPNPEGLLPEERAALEFCAKQFKAPTAFITLDQIAQGQVSLSEYTVLWWHYAREAKLPPVALAKPTLDAFRRYLSNGGNMLLSLQACQYVVPLGVEPVAPDQIVWKAQANVPPVGLRSTRNHSIFGLLPERFTLCEGGTLEPATYVRWARKEPKNGRLLAHAVINGKDEETYRSVYEWQPGQGRVLAIGEYGFRFAGPAGNQSGINTRFPVNVIRYLRSPAAFHITLRPRGKKTAVPSTGYLSKIGGAGTLFVERGTPVEIEFICMPREQRDGVLFIELTTVDEEKGVFEHVDMILQREITFKPGHEVHEKALLSTGKKPGIYHIIVRIAYNNTLPSRPDYMQRIFIVPAPEEGALLADKALVYVIETKEWLVEFEKVSGAIKGLTNKRYPTLNFAANEFNSTVAVAENRILLGDFFVTSRTPRAQWLSEGSMHSTDVRTVEIKGNTLVTKFLEPSGNLGGFHNVRCVSSFGFNRRLNCLEWAITIQNPGKGPLEVGDVYLPLSFNTAYNFFTRRPSDSDIFQRLIMRPDICGASGHVILQPRSGDPPFLVVVPTRGTPIECLAHDQQAHKAAGRGWEGLPYLYMFSKASREIENWGGWFNGHHSFILSPGASRTFGLRLFWARKTSDIDTILFSQGTLMSHISPGYVVPANMPATLRLRCALGVNNVAADKETQIEKTGDKGDVYRLTFSSPGHHTIKVSHGRGEVTILHLYSLPPLAALARARSAFILEHQQFKSPEDKRHLAFGMWDREEQMLVEETEKKKLSGGSGIVGLGPPLFLAAKNTVLPEAEEVRALEEYITGRLYGGIQDQGTFGIHMFLGEGEVGGTGRSYVYPHVFNLYFCMYRIGKYYGLTQVPAVNYLRLAHGTAMAYFNHPMNGRTNLNLGNPGEGTLNLIVDALRREGLSDQAAQLEQGISAKYGIFSKRPLLAHGFFVGGVLWPIDTTGLNGMYWLSRFNNSKEGLTRSLKMLLATRGNGRHWMWYGNDLAWAAELAKYPTEEAAALKHPSAYNAAALLDAAVLWRNPRYAELAYAGLLGPWARVTDNGEPQGFYAWEPSINRFDPWSGDVDVALAPTFLFLGSTVAYDRTFGLIGYGCHVTVDETTYTVVPADDMQKRVVSVPHRLVFEVGADLIKKVTVTKTADRMNVEIARGWPDDHEGQFALSGLPAGTYRVAIDDEPGQTLTSEQLAAGITIPFTEKRTDAQITIATQAPAAE